MNQVIELMNSHKSIRKFSDKKIDESIIQEVVKAAQCAPTSSNMQSYTIIRLLKQSLRDEIYRLIDKEVIIKASEVFVFCADLYRIERICKLHSAEFATGYTEPFIIATVDTAIVAQNFMLAAESYGIWGVYIGAIRNKPAEISKLLEIPQNVYPVFALCIGYPDEEPLKKPRLPVEVILKENFYSIAGDAELIAAYDKTMLEYNTKRDDTESWTKKIAKKMGTEVRPHMKSYLESQGFQFK